MNHIIKYLTTSPFNSSYLCPRFYSFADLATAPCSIALLSRQFKWHLGHRVTARGDCRLKGVAVLQCEEDAGPSRPDLRAGAECRDTKKAEKLLVVTIRPLRMITLNSKQVPLADTESKMRAQRLLYCASLQKWVQGHCISGASKPVVQ